MENKELKHTEISAKAFLISKGWSFNTPHTTMLDEMEEYASLKNKALQEEHAETTERLADTCLQQARELISKDEEIEKLKNALKIIGDKAVGSENPFVREEIYEVICKTLTYGK